jgi:hypothetical protein
MLSPCKRAEVIEVEGVSASDVCYMCEICVGREEEKLAVRKG